MRLDSVVGRHFFPSPRHAPSELNKTAFLRDVQSRSFVLRKHTHIYILTTARRQWMEQEWNGYFNIHVHALTYKFFRLFFLPLLLVLLEKRLFSLYLSSRSSSL